MTTQYHLNLLAEKNFLSDQLEKLPPKAILTRKSLEARINKISTKLDSMPYALPEPARIEITFNGQPVIGGYGIFVEFGTKAVGVFNEIVSSIAASLNTTLAAKGPVPNKEQHQLIITGIAIGSFGFVLEERSTNQLPLAEKSPISIALTKTLNLLNATLSSDEDLAETVSEIDNRAIDKVRSFLEIMDENNAICSMRFEEQNIKFKNTQEIQDSLLRLSSDNFSEEEIILRGEFHGYLPKSRTLEFLLYSSNEVIRCKIAPTVKDAERINLHLNSNIEIKVTKKVIGTGRPRYIMTETPNLES